MLTLCAMVCCISVPPENVRYPRGQELVYRGQCVDVVTGDTAGPRHTFELATRLFAVEADGELAVATSVTDGANNSATRFAVVTPGQKQKYGVPLFGPATLDPIAILDWPAQKPEVGATWSVSDGPRPPRRWKVVASESPPQGGVQCWKLRGEQQSHNWEMADENKAWRRDDVAWVDARTLVVQRLERVVIVRDPALAGGVRRIVTCHQLESNVAYPDRLEADVRAEIVAARQAFDCLAGQPATRMLDNHARRLATHVRSQPKTEWRHVVVAAEKQVEAARRGEIIAVASVEEQVPKWIVGRPAPDFVAKVGPTTSFQLSECRGRPVIVGVVQLFGRESLGMNSIKSLHEVDTFAKGAVTVVLADRSEDRCNFAAAGDEAHKADLAAQHPNHNLVSIHACQIESLRDGPTPRFILIDERGIVRQIFEGYGSEVPSLLRRFVESAGPGKATGPAEFDGRK